MERGAAAAVGLGQRGPGGPWGALHGWGKRGERWKQKDDSMDWFKGKLTGKPWKKPIVNGKIDGFL